MNSQVQILETVTRFAPFGIRFWDEVSRNVIRDGLQVVAYPPSRPALRTLAFVNPHGIYALLGLPGLRDIENGLPSSKKYPFIIEVTDASERFQPFLLSTELPWTGLFVWSCGPSSSPHPGSPLDLAPTFVPLYSSPTRTLPSGQAVLRAELWDPVLQGPAAFALVNVFYRGQFLAQSFADASGHIAVIFPYPQWRNTLASHASPVSLDMQPTWTIELRAAYTPQVPALPIPHLCMALQQSAATLWNDDVRTLPLQPLTLVFGQELVVQSTRTRGSTPPSVLLITPA